MSTLAAEAAEVRPEIIEIFADVFQHEGPVTRNTSPDDVSRWDSLQHIALVRTIEAMFDISLSMDEIVEMRSAGEIETVLARHGV